LYRPSTGEPNIILY